MGEKVPEKCPSCGAKLEWNKVGEGKEGFSVGKAAVGGLLLGPIGLLGGALGKKKIVYYCRNCQFQRAYDYD